MTDLQQVKTEALAAAVPHIEPYKEAVRESTNFTLAMSAKILAELTVSDDQVNYGTELNQRAGNAYKNIIAAMTPVMIKHGLSMEGNDAPGTKLMDEITRNFVRQATTPQTEQGGAPRTPTILELLEVLGRG